MFADRFPTICLKQDNSILKTEFSFKGRNNENIDNVCKLTKFMLKGVIFKYTSQSKNVIKY